METSPSQPMLLHEKLKQNSQLYSHSSAQLDASTTSFSKISQSQNLGSDKWFEHVSNNQSGIAHTFVEKQQLNPGMGDRFIQNSDDSSYEDEDSESSSDNTSISGSASESDDSSESESDASSFDDETESESNSDEEQECKSENVSNSLNSPFPRRKSGNQDDSLVKKNYAKHKLSPKSEEEQSLDGDDLRRAGRYGQQLLELLDQESHRASLLADLLERERRRNKELSEKQAILNRIQRKATHQEKHLNEMEEQTVKIEDLLHKTQKEVESERNKRKETEREIEELRKELKQIRLHKFQLSSKKPKRKPRWYEELSPQDLNTASPMYNRKPARAFDKRVYPLKTASPTICETPSTKNENDGNLFTEGATIATVSKILSEENLTINDIMVDEINICDLGTVVTSNQNDTTPSPRVQQTSLANSDPDSQNIGFSKTPEKKSEKGTIRTVAYGDMYEEVKQMYEEEREMRRSLEKEVETIRERQYANSIPSVRNEKPSIGIDLAVSALSNEIRTKLSRRATIGLCQGMPLPGTPPSANSKKETSFIHNILDGANNRNNNQLRLRHQFGVAAGRSSFRKDSAYVPRSLETSFNSVINEENDVNAANVDDVSDISVSAKDQDSSRRRKELCILTTRGEGEKFTTYLIQIESDVPNCFHMVQTRFRHFEKIYNWILQHSQLDLIAEPHRPPGKAFFGRSSLNVKIVKSRQTWLESTLKAVQREQPLLLDALLDYIGMLTRNECKTRRKRTI